MRKVRQEKDFKQQPFLFTDRQPIMRYNIDTMAIRKTLQHNKFSHTRSQFTSRQASCEDRAFQILQDSNQLIRNKLKKSQSSVLYLTDKVKEYEKQFVVLRQNSELKDKLISELQEKISKLTKKYQLVKLLSAQRQLTNKEVIQKTDKITIQQRVPSLNTHRQDTTKDDPQCTLCTRYWNQLRNTQISTTQLRSQVDRLTKQNDILTMMLQQAKSQLQRLGGVLAVANTKLEAFAQQSIEQNSPVFNSKKQSYLRVPNLANIEKCRLYQTPYMQEMRAGGRTTAQDTPKTDEIHFNVSNRSSTSIQLSQFQKQR